MTYNTFTCAYRRLAVSIRISEDDLGVDWKSIETIFLDTHNLVLWLLPLALAIVLRVITSRYHHQLIFPMCRYSSLLNWL